MALGSRAVSVQFTYFNFHIFGASCLNRGGGSSMARLGNASAAEGETVTNEAHTGSDTTAGHRHCGPHDVTLLGGRARWLAFPHSAFAAVAHGAVIPKRTANCRRVELSSSAASGSLSINRAAWQPIRLLPTSSQCPLTALCIAIIERPRRLIGSRTFPSPLRRWGA